MLFWCSFPSFSFELQYLRLVDHHKLIPKRKQTDLPGILTLRGQHFSGVSNKRISQHTEKCPFCVMEFFLALRFYKILLDLMTFLLFLFFQVPLLGLTFR